MEEYKENLNHSFQEMYVPTKLQVHTNKNMKRRQVKRNENIPCQSLFPFLTSHLSQYKMTNQFVLLFSRAKVKM